ncbi:hypothetical protein INR49_023392 [Caranx melampygus]|nr:hypothetical protein INR49_023392 [Caranx melampygus]
MPRQRGAGLGSNRRHDSSDTDLCCNKMRRFTPTPMNHGFPAKATGPCCCEVCQGNLCLLCRRSKSIRRWNQAIPNSLQWLSQPLRQLQLHLCSMCSKFSWYHPVKIQVASLLATPTVSVTAMGFTLEYVFPSAKKKNCIKENQILSSSKLKRDR